MTLGNLDKLVVSCKAYKERLIEHGFAGDKLEVIRWGIPIPNRKLKVAHKKPRLSSSNKMVLWTGFTQQIREKSFQLSLSLAQKITSQKSCIDFVFALKSECYDKAYEYFQNEHLLIITTDSESFMKLLDRVDVLLAPVVRLRSIIAPPLTWIECMARGIPIISTQAPGVDEILIHNQTGFVAKSNEELESLIEKVLEDKDLMSEVSINAKELVKEKYNLKDIAQDYLRLWRENVGATLSS
jgi:glycosyltransferase involved in cell wall biosynthesis